MKRNVYGKGYILKNINCLIIKIKKELKKITTESTIHETMRKVQKI